MSKTKETPAPEVLAKRNEASKMSKRKKKAESLGMTLEEYEASLKPLTPEEKRERRNKQSRESKARKRASKVNAG